MRATIEGGTLYLDTRAFCSAALLEAVAAIAGFDEFAPAPVRSR